MPKFETDDKGLNKNLTSMYESIDDMEGNIIRKSSVKPTSENMMKDEVRLFRDGSGSATIFFKDSSGDLFSLPMTKEK